ncbi:MAG: hypothetical protein C3F14_02915 [Deltaproteobacteria bacterium]|nr:MAG: hypothetical protein C3F14_02915 [Deltaproteobacteria bacterium]
MRLDRRVKLVQPRGFGILVTTVVPAVSSMIRHSTRTDPRSKIKSPDKTFDSIKNFCRYYRNHIFKEMVLRLDRVEWSSYQEFIIRTREGQVALKYWINLLTSSLEGNHERLFNYIKALAWNRTIQGFDLDFSFQIHQCFRQIIEDLLDKSTPGQMKEPAIRSGMWELNDVLFKDYNLIAASFIKAREEMISEKVTYLQEIYDFTQKIITIFDHREIVLLTLKKVMAFFNIKKSAILLLRKDGTREAQFYPSPAGTRFMTPMMENTLKKGVPLYWYVGKGLKHEIGVSKLKRSVCVPIKTHRRVYGVIALHNNEDFVFHEKELGLIYQLLYIMAVALENALMIEEIERSHKELSLLTSKILTIQEEERKRLAADIHDTLAQSLSGISYKIQFCKELIKNNPAKSIDQLNSLVHTVHQAIDQSKELIANLRPDLIDTIGLVPALKRHVDYFTRETGIQLTVNLTKKIHLPPEANICFFRIAQEALTNVYKHSGADHAELSLKAEKGQIVMVVEDKGRGFDLSEGASPVKDHHKLGLLSMKERMIAVGGRLVIRTSHNGGCRVEAYVPIH